MTEEMPIKTFIPWFGSDRTIAPEVGRMLEGCKWVGVPFAGSMAALCEIRAGSFVVNDLHKHVINLAQCIAEQSQILYSTLRALPFHPDILKEAQEYCKANEPGTRPDIEAAINYFICGWMGRSHKSGTVDEFNGGISRRWNANGGDSNTRYRNALRGLAAWSKIMRRCSFDSMDAFDFLAKCKDEPGHGLYVDPPWPDLGKDYRHNTIDHKRLRDHLRQFEKCHVVIRYGDHYTIRGLYEDADWFIHEQDGRNQNNDVKRELLITNWNPDRTLFT